MTLSSRHRGLRTENQLAYGARVTIGLFDAARTALAQLLGADRARVLGELFDGVTALVEEKQRRFQRVLPFGDYLVDRWDKARVLGFGEGTSIYDASLVIGDVRVGRDCWIGPFTVLDGSGGLTIGDRTTVSAGAHIYTHDSVDNVRDRAAPIVRSPTRIGSRVYLGPNVVVARGVTIGDDAVVGANSFVNRDVPAGARAVGNPARILEAK